MYRIKEDEFKIKIKNRIYKIYIKYIWNINEVIYYNIDLNLKNEYNFKLRFK